MSLPQRYLDEYDEPFGFMDFASVGTMSRTARKRIQQDIEWMSGGRGKIVPILMEQIEATKALVAELLGSDPDHVVAVPSTSAGLFATAFGLPGGNVLIPSSEFPANRYPWIRAAQAGRIETRFLDSDDGRYTPEMFAAAVDSDTSAVAVSQVDYQTGFRIDVDGVREAIGDALLVVDSVQSLGALASPFPAADVVVAGGQKWMRSGIGIAVMGVSDRALERLELTLSGWLGVEEPFDLEMATPHPALNTADRFVMGSPPITAMAGLRGALESLRYADIADVEATVLDRADTARDELKSVGCEILFTPEDPAERSGIISFRRPDESSIDTNDRLVDAGFTVTERNGWLRVASHATTHPDAPAALAAAVAG